MRELIAVCCETRMKRTNIRKVQMLSVLEQVMYTWSGNKVLRLEPEWALEAFGRCGKDINLLPVFGIEPRIVGGPASTVVSTRLQERVTYCSQVAGNDLQCREYFSLETESPVGRSGRTDGRLAYTAYMDNLTHKIKHTSRTQTCNRKCTEQRS
jgi:hypothetical protein